VNTNLVHVDMKTAYPTSVWKESPNHKSLAEYLRESLMKSLISKHRIYYKFSLSRK